MTRVGINYEPAIAGLIERAIERELVSAIEIIPDAYPYGRIEELRALLARFGVPYAFHFIGNSIASADFLENNRLRELRALITQLAPIHVSDHLTCSRSGRLDLAQNLAIPRTTEMVELVVDNIRFLRRAFGSQTTVLFENLGQLWQFPEDELDSAAFYREVIQRSGACCLLDVHNLYVDEMNFGTDPIAFIDGLPPELIREVHVSGGSWTASHRTYLDSHDARTPARVFELLDHVLQRAEPELIVFERVSSRSRRLHQEILEDLAHIHRINDRWTSRDARRSRRSS